VRVIAVNGLTLTVMPAESEQALAAGQGA